MVDPSPLRIQELEAELRELRAERDRQRDRLGLVEQALAKATVGIAACDRELRYTFYNETMGRLTLTRPEDTIGRRVEDVFPILRSTRVPEALAAALRGETTTLPAERYYDPTTGREAWSFSTHVPLHAPDGSVSGVLSTMVDVTELQRAALAVTAAHRENQALLDNLTAYVVRIDRAGRLTYANRLVLDVLGYSADELLGLPIDQTFLPGDARDRDGRDIAAVVRAAPEQLREGGINQVRTRSGKSVWVSWKSCVVSGTEGDSELLAVGMDVTEQRESALAAQRFEQRFQVLYQHMDEGVALHRVIRGPGGNPENYVIEDVNPRYVEMLGLRREAVLGKLATEAYGTEQPPYLEEYARVSLTGAPRTFETYFPPMERWFHISVAPLGNERFATIFSDVSQRKHQELEIARRKEELDRFFALSLDLLCIADTQGRFLELSPAWARVLGYPLDELIGLAFVDLVHPEDREATLAATAALAEGLSVVDFVNRYLHRDGSYRWLQWRSAAERGGRIYAVARDITQQREEHARLLQNEADLRRSQSVSRVGSYRVDLRTGQARSSTVLDEILGFSPGNGNDMETFRGILHPDDRAEYLASFQSDVLGARRPINREYRIIRPPDGAVRWVHDQNELELAPDGSVVAMFGTIQDITERKQAELERRQLEAKLQQAQKLESLNLLAGGIAHDFNNLLTSMLGNADLALGELPASAAARSNITDIETAARRAAELCRQLLAYSGKGKFQLQVVDLREVVQEMGQLLSVSVGKHAMLRYNFAPDLPGIEADPSQIRQVVMNLITNASEAIGEHSGVISVTTGTMLCDAGYLREAWSGSELAAGRYASLEVSDTGAGMDAATQKRVFDPFFSTKFAGRGLGLAAVLGIVRGHRGAIKLYSEPGRGSTFKLLFPAVDEPATPLQPRPAGSGWRGRGKVLLVDDEPVVLSVGRAILEKAGLTVFTAEDGEQALEVFREERDVACVILDLTMPRMDGETCFRELRRLDPRVKVVLTSGYNEQDVVSRFTGKGLAGFVQKPYRSAELVAAVRQVLEPDASSR